MKCILSNYVVDLLRYTQIYKWQHTKMSVAVKLDLIEVNKSKACAKYGFGLLLKFGLYYLIQKKQKGHTGFRNSESI